MKKILACILVLVLMTGAFFLGRLTGPATHSRTFYTRITQKSQTHLTVEGIPENDVNHRGFFQFDAESVKLTWRYTDITVDDLDMGDLIAVTYSGEVLEISPAVIKNVLEIQLLDDER